MFAPFGFDFFILFLGFVLYFSVTVYNSYNLKYLTCMSLTVWEDHCHPAVTAAQH